MKRELVLALILGVSPLSAISEEGDHPACDSLAMAVKVDDIGMADEQMLMKHMQETRARMDAVRRSQPRSDMHHRLMREHMADMRDAWEELHNMMLTQGCHNAAHGASTEVRLEVLERRTQAMQQMMDQMLGHISELERQ